MRLRWNHDGRGITDIPPRLTAFARRKRQEFYMTMLASAAAGIALGRGAAWSSGAAGAFSASALLSSVATMTAAIVLAVLLGAAA